MSVKRILSMTIVAATFLVAVAATASAYAKDAKSIVLHHDATIAGSHLASGNYRVTWQPGNADPTVEFMRGKKVVATANGKVVDRGRAYPASQVVFKDAADGGRVIVEIRFQGSSEVIVFNN